jgi:hypothetical protein
MIPIFWLAPKQSSFVGMLLYVAQAYGFAGFVEVVVS